MALTNLTNHIPIDADVSNLTLPNPTIAVAVVATAIIATIVLFNAG